MLNVLVRAVFGTKHERDAKRMRPAVESINALAPELERVSDAELRAKTDEFRKRLADGAELDDLLVEAFAACREAARRTVRMRHFDVQLMGGIVLHQGKIAEMATGEGKTLVATLPAYLNALPGLGTHIVTVNDYLARRDAQWMGPIYHALGLSLGVIQHEVSYLFDPSYASPDIRLANLRPCSRREAYHADITYGTNNEFGFDYLRDNMRFTLEEMVQREHHYAIVDEVDSILIDEARTPLIISGPAEGSTDRYYKIDRIIPKLKRAATIVEGKLSEIEAQAPGDYIVDEKSRAVSLTEQGISHCERLLNVENLYDPSQMEVLHHISQALKAHALFKKDVDYVVKEGQVIIVDEFTGRLMPGRRWSDGLHQAVEAKEGVRIESENQTLATITLQNYFRMYDKLAGMTGTAATEADEFAKIYELDVTVIPTNRPMSRVNYPDVVYKTEREKFEAVSGEIAGCYEKGQPVLVGTVSIEKSEHLSRLLKKRGIPHQVLNAKYHEREAEIVAQAGREKSVTIATNMAGRGTDILLGGNPDFLAKELMRKKGLDPALAPPAERQAAWEEASKVTEPEHERVVKLGGLHIIGTERIQRIMERLGMEEGEPIEHKLVTRAIGTAQKRVETRNFEIRKHLLEYDDVMNKQREIVYGLRRDILDGESQQERVLEWSEEVAEGTVHRFASRDMHADDWDITGLNEAMYRQFDLRLPPEASDAVEAGSTEALESVVQDGVRHLYEERERQVGAELFHRLERWILLGLRWEDGEFRGIDQLWKDHLLNMDHLKEGIGLRGYGQRDPLTEYKKEAFDMFQEMMDHLKDVVLEQLFKVRIGGADLTTERQAAPALAPVPRWRESHGSNGQNSPSEPRVATGTKVGRKDPCPCGSGKKYKKCCLLKGA